MRKSIVVHHYTRSAVWPEDMFQVFATTTVTDDGSIIASSSEDKRVQSPRIAAMLKNLDKAIIDELGADAKHVELLDDQRLPKEVRDALEREKQA